VSGDLGEWEPIVLAAIAKTKHNQVGEFILKAVDERKARGWMKMNCNQFDTATQLADACCDWLRVYEAGCKVPARLLELAEEAMKD
jgi:hypothetical protein